MIVRQSLVFLPKVVGKSTRSGCNVSIYSKLNLTAFDFTFRFSSIKGALQFKLIAHAYVVIYAFNLYGCQ